METRRWVNSSQPTTLTAATWLLYAGAAVSVLGAIFDRSFLSLLAAAMLVTAAYLTANGRSVGWFLGAATCVGQLVIPALSLVDDFADTIGLGLVAMLVLPAVTVAMLVHPDSRDYQRAWFT